jgi:hypothetical protein
MNISLLRGLQSFFRYPEWDYIDLDSEAREVCIWK